MQFRSYLSILANSSRIFMREPGHKHMDPIHVLCSASMSIDPGIQSVGTKVCVQEWDWMQHSCPTVFVDSGTLPEMVARMPVIGDIRPILEAWRGPCAFSFRHDARAGGIDIPGTLFSYFPSDLRLSLLRQFTSRFGPDNVQPDLSNIDGRDALQFSCTVKPYSFHTVIPVDRVTEPLEDPSWFENHKLMNTFMDLETNEREQQIQTIVMRVTLGLIVYAAAFPDALRPGLPHSVKQRELGKVATIKGARHRTLCGPTQLPGERQTHFRSGHFRILAHERFRRDEYGRVRVIHVRETIVKGQIDARTMEDPNVDPPDR